MAISVAARAATERARPSTPVTLSHAPCDRIRHRRTRLTLTNTSSLRCHHRRPRRTRARKQRFRHPTRARPSALPPPPLRTRAHHRCARTSPKCLLVVTAKVQSVDRCDAIVRAHRARMRHSAAAVAAAAVPPPPGPTWGLRARAESTSSITQPPPSFFCGAGVRDARSGRLRRETPALSARGGGQARAPPAPAPRQKRRRRARGRAATQRSTRLSEGRRRRANEPQAPPTPPTLLETTRMAVEHTASSTRRA